ncbi:unnamed protein product [Fraxinus pennsylvanica]|uniref:Uncharacterized protein n=1 Tax=Fraxinus pennsylvanica TaxID=56036 RepID=A0AAD1YZT5_9LAMI|nr:unnamed protein product [Fraxinus pennsylvanica]
MRGRATGVEQKMSSAVRPEIQNRRWWNSRWKCCQRGNEMKNEYEFLKEIGLGSQNLGCYINGVWHGNGPVISSVNPANNQIVVEASVQDYEEGMQACAEVVKMWKQIGDALRAKLHHLGRLVSLEMGKILAERIGEVQMFRFARKLYNEWCATVKPGKEMFKRFTAMSGMICCLSNSISPFVLTFSSYLPLLYKS